MKNSHLFVKWHDKFAELECRDLSSLLFLNEGEDAHDEDDSEKNQSDRQIQRLVVAMGKMNQIGAHTENGGTWK